MQYSVKYRPQRFAHVVGQEVAKRILVNSIYMNRQPVACLFNGVRGTGKTSLARLYAQALNCENFTQQGDLCGVCESCLSGASSHPSIIERDAATYNGVDDVRDLELLLNQCRLHAYRVLILDECHMLSKQAQAALLKLLEGPPPNTVILLVTTDPQKLETTLRSRCLQLPLKVMTPEEIAVNLRRILQSEGLAYDESVVDAVSRQGGGSLRDAQQVLEGLVLSSGSGVLDESSIKGLGGVITLSEYRGMAEVLDRRDLRMFLEEIRAWEKSGSDLKLLYEMGVPQLLRDFMIVASGIPEGSVQLNTGLSYAAVRNNITLSREDIKRMVSEWEVTSEHMRYTTLPRVIWSMYAAKVCCG
jgi:DNA polymerase-3 subunit gamma/tau